MGGWKYDRRKKTTRIYERIMGPLIVLALVAAAVQWLIEEIGKGLAR